MSIKDKASSIADGSERAGDGAKNSTFPPTQTDDELSAYPNIINAPDRIWLEVGYAVSDTTNAAEDVLDSDIINRAESVTWAEAPSEIGDIEYVRADLVDVLSRQPAPVETQGKRGSCPCEWTTPCSSSCTCVRPYLSGGCARCCRYGSDEQRKRSAERLAQPAPVVTAMLQKVREMEQRWRGDAESSYQKLSLWHGSVDARSSRMTAINNLRQAAAAATARVLLAELERIDSTAHDPDEVDVREQNRGAVIDSACYADYHKSCASPKTCQCECHRSASPVDSPAVDVREQAKRLVAAMVYPDLAAAIEELSCYRDSTNRLIPTNLLNGIVRNTQLALEQVAVSALSPAPTAQAEALLDRQWLAGARFGWNCGITEAREMFDAAVAGRHRDLLEHSREARSGAGVAPTVEGGESYTETFVDEATESAYQRGFSAGLEKAGKITKAHTCVTAKPDGVAAGTECDCLGWVAEAIREAAEADDSGEQTQEL